MRRRNYIWNRLDRVTDHDNVPEMVVNYFKEWRKDVKRNYKLLPLSKQKQIDARIKRQKDSLNLNLKILGYDEFYN
tara:strand:+ start:478 stop:705 length:228 start_codon:yes stop_codon:yes gene_type:complete